MNLTLTNGSYEFYDDVNNVSRMVIDNSGNLLVGQSSSAIPGSGNTVTGISIAGQYDAITISRADAQGLIVNRNSDGKLVDFNKDGTTVGSIGTQGSSTYIAGASSGLRFAATNIMPVNSSGTFTDNTSDLGGSTERFKDLYLSGGVVFDAVAGNATSNTLDDYEEGTWTPTVEGAGTGGSYTLSGVSAQYTKVGNLVTLKAQFGFSAASGGTSYARVHGLPFSYSIGAGVFGTLRADNYNFQATDPVTVIIAATTSGSGNTLNFLEIQDNTGPIDAPITGISTSTIIGFTITYQTS
jgi:hypothetical protein